MKNRTIFGLLLFAFGFIGLFTACNKELFTENVAPVRQDELQQVVEERGPITPFQLDVLNAKLYTVPSNKLIKNGDVITFTGTVNDMYQNKIITHNINWWTKSVPIASKLEDQRFEINIPKGSANYFSINPAQGSTNLKAVVPTITNQQPHHIIPLGMVIKPQNQPENLIAREAARLLTIAAMDGFHINASYNGIALFNKIAAKGACVARTYHQYSPAYDKMVAIILERWMESTMKSYPAGKNPIINYKTSITQAKLLAPIVNVYVQSKLIPFLREALQLGESRVIAGYKNNNKKIDYCSSDKQTTLNQHFNFWNIDSSKTVDADLQALANKHYVNLFVVAPTINPNTPQGQ